MDYPASNPYVRHLVVPPEAIDAQGHVSNVQILAWMNEIAIEHSDSLGYTVERYKEIGGIFVVKRHEIDYLASAYEGERLIQFTWPSGARRSAAERRHELRREDDGVVIARGLNQWVYVDTETGRPKRMPPEVLEAFDPAKFV